MSPNQSQQSDRKVATTSIGDYNLGFPGQYYDAASAHGFIVGSLKQGTLDFARVRAWIESHLEQL